MTTPTYLESLDNLAMRYGTDKSTLHHGYTRYYEKHFEPLRHLVRSVLEIGVDKGGSVRMWRDFFPYAQIWGIDYDNAAPQHAGERITIRVGDQTDAPFLTKVAQEAGGFDIIIDDGGHYMLQQAISFKTLWSAVHRGGFYVVEDLHTSYWDTYQNGPRMTEILKELVDDVNMRGKATSKAGAANAETLSEMEKSIAAVHFYPSTCIIDKL